MPALPPPPANDDVRDYDAIVAHDLQRLFRALVAVRAMVAPLLSVIAITVLWVDDAAWRAWVLGGLVLFAVVSSLVVELRARRAPPTIDAATPNLVTMAVAQVVVITSTGGVDSPLLPVVIPFGLMGAFAVGKTRTTAWVLGVQVTLIVALTVLQATGWAPALDMPALGAPGPAGVRALRGLVVVTLLAVGGAVSLHLRHRFESMIRAGLAASAEQLETWRTWSRDLESLSGEIAHELKNPLAAIRGLAALVERDIPEGRAAERIAVLRSEIDRMQGIVDEFLAFSRPLTPLSLDRVDLVALCDKAVRLHEAPARRRGIALARTGDAPPVPADARKILQILVNLLQNAIEAAPDGTAVDIVVSHDRHLATVDVVDRGAGVPPRLRDRVFEAGVTGRDDGSGLGLPIALAIARQHSGDLALLDRPGGGTIARLTLPRSAE